MKYRIDGQTVEVGRVVGRKILFGNPVKRMPAVQPYWLAASLARRPDELGSIYHSDAVSGLTLVRLKSGSKAALGYARIGYVEQTGELLVWSESEWELSEHWHDAIWDLRAYPERLSVWGTTLEQIAKDRDPVYISKVA